MIGRKRSVLPCAIFMRFTAHRIRTNSWVEVPAGVVIHLVKIKAKADRLSQSLKIAAAAGKISLPAAKRHESFIGKSPKPMQQEMPFSVILCISMVASATQRHE